MQVDSLRDSPAPWHKDETKQDNNSANPTSPAQAAAGHQITNQFGVSMATVQKTFRTDPRLQHLAGNRPKSKGGRPPAIAAQPAQPSGGPEPQRELPARRQQAIDVSMSSSKQSITSLGNSTAVPIPIPPGDACFRAGDSETTAAEPMQPIRAIEKKDP